MTSYLYTVFYLNMYNVVWSFQKCHCPATSVCPKSSKKILIYFNYSMQYLLPLKAIASVIFECRNTVPMLLLIQSRDQFQVPKLPAHWLHQPKHAAQQAK